MRIGLRIAQSVILLLMGTCSAQEITFRKQVLTDRYYCDGIQAGDINNDDYLDIVAGPFWYEGPEFQKAHEIYEPLEFVPEASPTNSMFSFVWDFNSDGWNDVLVLGRVHLHAARWYENPGEGLSHRELWKRHFVFHRIRGESPSLEDIDNDGQPELTCHWNGRWGYIEPKGEASLPWTFVPVGTRQDLPQFYHGQGIGDVNNDGRSDLIINDDWYEQPPTGKTLWNFHRNKFSMGRGGAQMFAYDVDGDSDNDVVSAVDAHGWGLAWYEHSPDRFKERLIMASRKEEKKFGVAFSQPHAQALVDLNGDELMDIVTGKRMWAHGPNGDVEPNAAAVVYWFELQRTENGVRYVPHKIDDCSGVGVQIDVRDVNNDQHPDILTASKLGSFLFLQEVSQ